VPGIESLLIGTSDLSMELGIPGQLGDERFVDDNTLSSMRATPMGSSRE
jgi:2-keto-3-deoxy-L-rhamnonate aldolase RhmA